MIKITAKAVVKEENQEFFIEVAKSLVKESRNEEGNVSYGLFKDTSNNEVLTFIEEWKSMEAIKFHGQTDHFLSAIEKLKETAESFEINLYSPLV